MSPDSHTILEPYKKDFELFYELYEEYNSHTNISSVRDKNEVYKKHFEDSLESLKYILNFHDLAKNLKYDLKILDLGSGGGFPALPLAIVLKKHSAISICAVDSNNKKTKFINTIKEKLNLENLTVVQARAEELSRKESYREAFDIVLSRALANLPVLLEYAIPFIKIQGIFIAYKKLDINKELEASEKISKKLGAELEKTYKYEEKQLLIYRKIKACPDEYPRQNSVIMREASKNIF
jgi:16S rRNA (guanine527-N7)-methyltransferase